MTRHLTTAVVSVLAALWLGPFLTALRAQTPVAEPAAVPAVVSPPVVAPSTEVAQESCVTADCHAGVKRHKILHGPVNVNACDACHTLTDAKTHSYVPAREKADACTFCHVVETQGATTLHEPVTARDCTGCHDPHGGFDRSFLKTQSMGELCATCHQDVVGDKHFVHGPVAAGACGMCHEPHASKNPKLLVETGRGLCIGCHSEMDQQLDEVGFVHKPVKEDCLTCHSPHATDFPMLVKQAPGELCTTACHEDIKRAVTEAKHKHSAVTQDSGCVNCHTPHGGDLAKLMKDRPVNLCMACHDRSVKAPDGRVVASVLEVTDPKMIKHGPVADGSCGGCHNVHGSDYAKLLIDEYPGTFYQPFDLKSYSLCFECHDKELVMTPNARGLTGFRNGDENLHFMHVNKNPRGRSCRACHSVHASTLALHLRETVPYGKWELPINYKQTDTGGSCSPGCHKSKSYDRDEPVDYTTPAQ
jgi:predicted CXXCH cytochrome family protein